MRMAMLYMQMNLQTAFKRTFRTDTMTIADAPRGQAKAVRI